MPTTNPSQPNKPIVSANTPAALPSWTPAVNRPSETQAPQTQDDETYTTAVHKLSMSLRGMSPAEFETKLPLATRVAQSVQTIASELHVKDRHIRALIGELGVLVEDYALYKFLKLDTVAEFWAETGWSIESVRRHVRLYRQAHEVVEAVGLDYGPFADTLTSEKAQAVMEIARPHRQTVLSGEDLPDDVRQQLRQEFERVSALRDVDVAAERRAKKGKTAEKVPIYHELQLVWRTDREPQYVARTVITSEILQARQERNTYDVYRIGGREVQLSELEEELDRLRAARNVTPAKSQQGKGDKLQGLGHGK